MAKDLELSKLIITAQMARGQLEKLDTPAGNSAANYIQSLLESAKRTRRLEVSLLQGALVEAGGLLKALDANH